VSATRQRLVGMELFSERPGDSAAFYAWLLGPGSGHAPQDWNPVSLLFSHGVCGVWRTEEDGPPQGWVPVLSLDDVEESGRRAVAAGGHVATHQGRTYLVDADGVWTRVVRRNRLPLDVDPDAIGETNADYYCAEPAECAREWADRLLMEPVELIGDVDGLNFVVAERRPAFGTVSYVDELLVALPQPTWVVYFAVPDIPLAVQRAAAVGTGVAIPPSHEEYNDWCVLVDPFGVPFGLSLYYHHALGGLRVRTPRGEEAFADAVDLPLE
jgi:predicted enzyme related to lactoylglutathione lyase